MVPGSFAAAFVPGVRDTPGVTAAGGFPLPRNLSGVSVTTDGIAAPILAVANSAGVEQVNFQVPFELAGRTSVSVVVSRDGVASLPVSVAVQEIQPAIYSVDGKQAVVVHNSDFTLVTADRPLVPGEDALVYATGLGRVTNQPATGASAPLVPLASAIAGVRLTLGGIVCEVPFAGLAPSLAGVYQVSFRVPPGVQSGMQTLRLSVGAAASPPLQALVR
jgi:uncharacterized protein (TIGR03437 family)